MDNPHIPWKYERDDFVLPINLYLTIHAILFFTDGDGCVHLFDRSLSKHSSNCFEPHVSVTQVSKNGLMLKAVKGMVHTHKPVILSLFL